LETKREWVPGLRATSEGGVSRETTKEYGKNTLIGGKHGGTVLVFKKNEVPHVAQGTALNGCQTSFNVKKKTGEAQSGSAAGKGER